MLSHYRAMENVLVYDKTGQQYMLDPRPQDLQRGVIQYVPELHSHLLAFVTVNGQTYSNNPELVDWDKGVEEWQESLMGQWPFGNKPSDEQLAIQEAINCLECLESYLDFEEWQMDKIEEQENDDDDDDDDDDDMMMMVLLIFGVKMKGMIQKRRKKLVLM